MAAKHSYGTGSLYEKSGAYYGRWRTADGRLLNRKVGPLRPAGSIAGLTRAQAEREFSRMQDAEELRPFPRRTAETPPAISPRGLTVWSQWMPRSQSCAGISPPRNWHGQEPCRRWPHKTQIRVRSEIRAASNRSSAGPPVGNSSVKAAIDRAVTSGSQRHDFRAVEPF